MNWIWVFLGGGIGSILRLGVGKIAVHFSEAFPLSTLVSNILATGLLALIASNQNYTKEHWMWYFFAIGICGGFSTFSTFSMENVLLFEQGKINWLFLNILLSVVLSFGLFYLILLKK